MPGQRRTQAANRYASPQAPLHARQNAIECLNHFALNWAFNEPKFPKLQPFAEKYLEVLGVLANDQDPNVLKDVCKGFVCLGWRHTKRRFSGVRAERMRASKDLS
eukprot:g15476.t1